LFFASSIASLYLGTPSAIITEEAPLDSRPNNRCHYAKAKILCEQLLEEMHSQHGLPCVIFRPGFVVGEGSPPQHLGLGEWPSETLCIRWGRDIANKLPLVLVDDVANAFLCAIRADINTIAGKKFNLIGDVRLSASEYFDILRKESRRDFRLRRQSVPTWALIESAKWVVKLVARRSENSRLTWHELAYRTAASQFQCEGTKRMLQWRPTADREVFVERAIRAPLRGQTAS
jgi:nucleoside-diphosphate-sugar epimerase